MTAHVQHGDQIPSGYDDVMRVLECLPILVRETRRRKGQSLREAAKASGTSFSTLSRVETRTGDPALSSVYAILRWVAS